MPFEFTLTDNSGDVLNELGLDIPKGLEAVGKQCMNYAALELENKPARVDTGLLRNSITYVVNADEQSVTVGTNVKYAIYVHEGTGIYAPNGDTSGYWVYVVGGDESKKGLEILKKISKRLTFCRECGIILYKIDDKAKEIIESILNNGNRAEIMPTPNSIKILQLTFVEKINNKPDDK